MTCQEYLDAEIKFFTEDTSDTWHPKKPSLDEELPKLKYQACTEAYIANTPLSQLVAFFGDELVVEVIDDQYTKELDI